MNALSGTPSFALPFPCLVADVGGTNARFSILTGAKEGLTPMIRLETGGDADFTRTVQRAIAAGGYPAPRSMLLAVAGPPEGKRAALSNAWAGDSQIIVDGEKLAEGFELEQGLLFNDFEALSLSLPFLGATDLVTLAEAPSGAPPRAPMVVIGPGTGLGVGGVIPHADRWLPVSGEGGHVLVGPVTADERLFWPHLGHEFFSAEDIISGRGISRLYRASVASLGLQPQDDSPPAITERALSGGEQAASDTVRRLLLLVSRLAGDMALVLGARGGAFIGGGIVPRLLPLLDRAAFLEAFHGNGRAVGFLMPVPVRIITAPDAALIGLASVARNPEAFALDYATRGWR